MNFRGSVLLSPLTKGGNLPFRRLVLDYGAEITTSEMAYARQVVRRSRSELALLRKHPDETCFGVQIAAGSPPDAVKAGCIAAERGAAFVDLNAGCPIHDTVRRGMGATLLRRPAALARMVEAMVKGIPVPITVKIRSGWRENDINASEIAGLVEEAGATALTIHARTREQRYTKTADWELIGRLAAERSIPVIGNGDILTWYEAIDRWETAGCASVMIARGALIKPWLFREIADRKSWEPTAEERVGIYYRLATYMREHFRDDEKGRERTMRFLPFHLGFFCRYRPLPAERFREDSRTHPLMQTRIPEDADLPLLEALLRDPAEDLHQILADALWDSVTSDDAVARFLDVAEARPPVAGQAGEVSTAQG
jgi:tRNA-dihydrouridine synthase 3